MRQRDEEEEEGEEEGSRRSGRLVVSYTPSPIHYGERITQSSRRALLSGRTGSTPLPSSGGSGAGGETAPSATRVLCRRVERAVGTYHPSCSAAIKQLTNDVVPQLDVGASDDKARIEYIRSLLQLGNRVTNWCQYLIGDLVNQAAGGAGITDVVMRLCNTASEARSDLETRTVRECAATTGCCACTESESVLRSPDNTSVASPCTDVQVELRLRDVDFANFTPSFFNQCARVARHAEEQSALLTCAEPPSDLRCLIDRLVAVRGNLEAEGLPSYITGFSAPPCSLTPNEQPITAVHYTDGDGGVLVVDYFPGLLEACNMHNVPTQVLAGHNLTLVAFREAHHDAIELGHVYSICVESVSSPDSPPAFPPSRHEKEYGYDALVLARRNIAKAVEVHVEAKGADLRQQRLLVEVSTREKTDLFARPTGLRLIEGGLSFPTSGAGEAFLHALRDCTSGVNEFGLGAEERLKPWNLKAEFAANGPSHKVEVEVTDGTRRIQCTVSNRLDRLNEANVMVLRSLIPGAGLGLFLRPTPLSREPFSVSPHRFLCVYSDTAVSLDVGEAAASTDYLFQTETRGRTLVFNPEHFDGANIGRYVNQGGLLEGLQEMASGCDGGRFHPHAINEAFERHCTITYKVDQARDHLMLAPSRVLRSSSDVQELFGNYRLEYWVKLVLSKHEALGRDSEIVRLVLWSLLSPDSCMDEPERRHLLEGYDIAPELRRHFESLPCPCPAGRGRRRRLPQRH